MMARPILLQHGSVSSAGKSLETHGPSDTLELVDACEEREQVTKELCQDYQADGAHGNHTQRAAHLFLDLPPELLAHALRAAHSSARQTCRAFRTAWCDGRAALTVCWRDDVPLRLDALQSLLRGLPVLQHLTCRVVGGGRNDALTTCDGARVHFASLAAACCPHLTSLQLHTDRCRSLTGPAGGWTAGPVGGTLTEQSAVLTWQANGMQTRVAPAGWTVTELLALPSLAGGMFAAHLPSSAGVTLTLYPPSSPSCTTMAFPTRLVSLSLWQCHQLSDIRAVAACASLTSLVLHSCPGVTCIAALSDCGALASLCLRSTHRLASLAPLALCGELTDLTLDTCSALADDPAIALLTQLTALSVLSSPFDVLHLPRDGRLAASSTFSTSAPSLASSSSSSLARLATLTVRFCGGALVDSHAQLLRPPASLRSVDLRDNCALQDVGALAACPQLTSVNLCGCLELTGLSLGAGLAPSQASLRSLDLTDCERVSDFGALSQCDQLTSLTMVGCSKLMDLESVAGCTSLRRLDVSHCFGLRSVRHLAALTSRLQSLDLGGCKQLDDLQALSSLAALTRLVLGDCAQVRSLAPLCSCTALASLDLGGCSGLVKLRPLSVCSRLTSLDLSDCRQVESLQPLRSCASFLQSLVLRGCSGVANLRPLAACTQLRTLDLSGCTGVRSVAPLAACAALRRLKVYGLMKFHDGHDVRVVLHKLAPRCQVEPQAVLSAEGS